MSVIALFGSLTFPVMISVTVLVTRLIAISVLALGDPWFLFPFRAVHWYACPTWCCCPWCWSDGLSNCQRGWIPHLDQSPKTAQYHVHQDWEVVHLAWWTLPYPDWEDTSGRKSGRCPGMLGGFKTPNSFNLATSSAVNNSRSPGRLGKIRSVAWKGPIVQNGTSCHV